MNQGLNNYKNVAIAFERGWRNVRVSGFLPVEQVEHAPVNAFWPDGSCKLVDLSSGEVVGKAAMEAKAAAQAKALEEARLERIKIQCDEEVRKVQLDFYRSRMNQLPLASVSEIFRAGIFKSDEERAIATSVMLSKLPKFSTAMLKRMEEATKERTVEASDKFYTWRSGNKASSTSHTAWGHRRNGGGKGKKETLIEMNSEKAAADRIAARKIRQKENKEEREKQAVKDAENLARITAYVEANKVVAPVVEVVAVEETDYQKFKREEFETFRVRVKVIDLEYVSETPPPPVKEREGDWKIIETGRKRVTKLEKEFTSSLFTTAKVGMADNVVIPEEVVKVHWKKAKKASMMCRSVAKDEACPHADGKCNFAHNFEELSPKCCANSSCRFVKRVGEKFINKGKKLCLFKHEGETKIQFCQRIGVKCPAQPICGLITSKSTTAAFEVTPTSDRVLKPYSATQAWAPLDEVKPTAAPMRPRESRWGARKN